MPIEVVLLLSVLALGRANAAEKLSGSPPPE
jgi:hypothetical protein